MAVGGTGALRLQKSMKCACRCGSCRWTRRPWGCNIPIQLAAVAIRQHKKSRAGAKKVLHRPFKLPFPSSMGNLDRASLTSGGDALPSNHPQGSFKGPGALRSVVLPPFCLENCVPEEQLLKILRKANKLSLMARLLVSLPGGLVQKRLSFLFATKMVFSKSGNPKNSGSEGLWQDVDEQFSAALSSLELATSRDSYMSPCQASPHQNETHVKMAPVKKMSELPRWKGGFLANGLAKCHESLGCEPQLGTFGGHASFWDLCPPNPCHVSYAWSMDH